MANAVEAVVVSGMRARAHTFWTIAACTVALAPACVSAEEGFDTEHMFGFMIGTDVGNPGEREFQSQTTGRFGKDGGTYRALGQEVELEFVPLPNFRIEVGGFAAPRHQRRYRPRRSPPIQLAGRLARPALSLARPRHAPFGMTAAADPWRPHRRDHRREGADVRPFTLAFDREIMPNFAVAALNLFYQPEWTRFEVARPTERSPPSAPPSPLMRVRPDVLLGGEARYFRQYEGIGLGDSRARPCSSGRPPISSCRSARA